MNADVAEQLARLARRQQRRRLTTIGGYGLAAAVALAATLALTDWRWQAPPGSAGRWLLTTLGAVGVATAIAANVRVACREASPLEIAQAIDRGSSDGGSLVSSGWAFAGTDPDDLREGSAELRRSVVLRASTSLASLDVGTALPQPAWRVATGAAAASCAAVALAAWLAPWHFAAGVARLADPTSAAQWPRRHELQFVDAPTLVPRGGEFVVVLVDANGPLPDPVRFERRSSESGRGEVVAEQFAAPSDRVEIRVGNVQESFEYRAVGGDDRRMPWRAVEAAPPPEILELQIEVAPPPYANRPSERHGGEARLLAGSQVAVSGRLSESATRVRILPPESVAAAPTPMRLDAAGLRFITSDAGWTPSESGSYRIEIVTRRGMTAIARRRLQLDVQPDRPPLGAIVAPAGELETLATATIPLSYQAGDDVGLAAVEVAVGDASGGTATETLRHRESIPLALAAIGDSDLSNQGERAVGIHRLSLANAAAVAGDQLAVRLRVVDSRGQIAFSSRPLAIRVVGRDRLLKSLGADLDALLERLIAAEGAQRAAHAPFAAVGSDAIDLVAVRNDQHQVRELLLVGGAAAVQAVADLRFRYAINDLAAEPAARQLQLLAESLDRPIPALLGRIDGALAAVNDFHQDDSERAAASAAVGAAQRELLVLLAVEIDALARWSELQQLKRELTALVDLQLAERRQTAELARAALAGSVQPTDRQRRERTITQRDVAFRLAETFARYGDVATRLAADQPTDAEQLQRIAALAVELGVQPLAAAAAEDLAGGRYASATEAQQGVVERLERLLAEFAAWDFTAAQERLRDLQSVRRDAGRLRRDVESLAADRSETRHPPQAKPLQSAAAERAAALAERTTSLAPAAARDLADAARELGASSGERSAAAAADKLAQADAKLADAEARQKQLAAELKLRRLAGEVDRFLAREREVIAGLGSLDSNAGEAVSRPLASEQAALRDDVLAAARSVAELGVFAFALRATAAEMDSVAAALESTTEAAEALPAAERALRRLEQLAAAIAEQSEATPRGGATTDAAPDAERAAERQQRSLAEATAQLRLLRELQSELRNRTAQLERAGDERGELPELQRQQQALVELARELAENLAAHE
ncbi:MAG: hypothetical protein KF847_06320 [Pirellulales bacterium]|nr:hypothetical protein [Pirellulales bacterium]